MLHQLICLQCKQLFVLKTSKAKAEKRKYCSSNCANQAFKVQFSGERNPAFGKVYRTKATHPEWAAKMSVTSSTRRINAGDKNGMKRPEVAKRMSKTRREKVTSDPIYRKATSDRIRKAWADGKYDGVRVGQCKWYEHMKSNGAVVKLQGTWEVVFAQFLDSLGVEYSAHQGRIPYIDSVGVKRSYYPDFYIPMWDAFVDVKGAMFYDLQHNKMKNVIDSNPDKFIEIVTYEYFNSIGLDVRKLSIEYSNHKKEFK